MKTMKEIVKKKKKKNHRKNKQQGKYYVIAFFYVLLIWIIIAKFFRKRYEYAGKKSMSLKKKKKLIEQFYDGFPYNGFYVECLRRSNIKSKSILSTYFLNLYSPVSSPLHSSTTLTSSNKYNYIVFFDFDDTLIFTYPYLVKSFKSVYLKFPPIQEIIDIVSFCKQLKCIVIILTARVNNKSTALQTISNCKQYNIKVDFIICISSTQKKQFRSEIENKSITYILQKYNHNIMYYNLNCCYLNDDNKNIIILSIGDHWNDVLGDNYYGLKLPDTYDMNAYLHYKGNFELL